MLHGYVFFSDTFYNLTLSRQDIIPRHGFMSKPSTLWPIDPLPPKDSSRIPPTKSNPPPEPGHADALKPSKERLEEDQHENNTSNGEAQTQREMLRGSDVPIDESSGRHSSSRSEDSPDYDIDTWEPKPPKVLMNDPDAVPLELHAQIQMYALTE
jgi:hypothetical protein